MAIKKKIRKTKFFINEGIWDIELEELSKVKARAIKFLQIAIVTLKTFAQQKVGPQAVALSYFCTMALIPLIAVMFVVTGGLGLEGYLTDYLKQTLGDTGTVNFIIEKAGTIIEIAKSGATGLVSALTFVWLVIWMMFCVERSFNSVWKVSRSRNILKSFTYYIGILILSPFVVIIFFSFPIVYTNLFSWMGVNMEAYPIINSFASWGLFYLLTGFTMTAMFKYIPHAHVRYRNAWRAAFPTAIIFCIFQYIYLESQTFMTQWNAVYGVLAAIPLFMIWLNISWQIILYGAQLSYALQNVDNYKETL